MGRLILVLCLSLVVVGFAQIDSLILEDIKDCILVANIPTSNYGAYADVYVGGGYLGVNKWSELIQFDLSSIPVGCTIDSAYISYAVWTASGGNVCYTGAVLEAWNEGDKTGSLADSFEVNYNCYSYPDSIWSIAGCRDEGVDRTAALDSGVVGSLIDKVYVTNTVIYILAHTNNGMIHWTAVTGGYYVAYAKEHRVVAVRPKLSVYYTVAIPITDSEIRGAVINKVLQIWRAQ